MPTSIISKGSQKVNGKVNSIHEINKKNIDIREDIFGSTNFLSSSRETYNTVQTNYDPNCNNYNINKRNTVLESYKNVSDNKNSPMKIIDRISEKDFEVSDESDLKARSLRQITQKKIMNNMKIEKFVKEIELKDEDPKSFINNETLTTKPHTRPTVRIKRKLITCKIIKKAVDIRKPFISGKSSFFILVNSSSVLIFSIFSSLILVIFV